MYESFFKFRTRPFSPVPQPKNYFPTEVCETARRSLERAIERGEGPGLVIGPPGTGKSLLCHLLAEKFRGPFAVALLTGGRLKSCQALLQQGNPALAGIQSQSGADTIADHQQRTGQGGLPPQQARQATCQNPRTHRNPHDQQHSQRPEP